MVLMGVLGGTRSPTPDTRHPGWRGGEDVVDAIVTGVHESGDSHYELLRAFASDAVLGHARAVLKQHGYRSHEFGYSVLLARQRPAPPPPRAYAKRMRCISSASRGSPRTESRKGSTLRYANQPLRSSCALSSHRKAWSASSRPRYSHTNATGDT